LIEKPMPQTTTTAILHDSNSSIDSALGTAVANPASTQRALPCLDTRIFAAYHGTQLLVIQHLRRHLRRPPAREFLLWHPFESNPAVDRFMHAVVLEAGFDGTLDMRDFESLKPRTQGSLAWWFESARRLRSDASALRAWMAENGIDETTVELWADDPLHFYAIFPRAVLCRACQIKIPHCFNHEDSLSVDAKQGLEASWAAVSWPKKYFFMPWQRWMSGVDLRMERIGYDRAYTFASPSPWSANSLDLSALIAVDAFAGTYGGLPRAMRAEVDNLLAPVRAGAKPLVLLLLFGLGEDDAFRTRYQRAMARIFSAHAAELQGGSLVVKWHPGASGEQEPLLVEWLRNNIPAQVHEIRHPLNLEFMLPQLRPDYVVAGLCGSLPIVRDLGAGRPIIISEWLDQYLAERPGERPAVTQFLRGIEVW
jgi:hypothetical protein